MNPEASQRIMWDEPGEWRESLQLPERLKAIFGIVEPRYAHKTGADNRCLKLDAYRLYLGAEDNFAGSPSRLYVVRFGDYYRPRKLWMGKVTDKDAELLYSGTLISAALEVMNRAWELSSRDDNLLPNTSVRPIAGQRSVARVSEKPYRVADVIQQLEELYMPAPSYEAKARVLDAYELTT